MRGRCGPGDWGFCRLGWGQAADAARRNFRSQTQKDRSAEPSVRSPFRELHLRHRHRLEPYGLAVHFGFFRERPLFAFDTRELIEKLRDRGVIEAGAAVTRVTQFVALP